MKIILVDWAGYPLQREKKIGKTVITCGLEIILKQMAKYNAGIDFNIILIINDCDENKKETYKKLKSKYKFIEKIFFRSNIGQDLGAYNWGYNYLKKREYAGEVLFMNSGVAGPYKDNWLLKYANLFNKKEKIGLCGISMNSHITILNRSPFKPHV